MSAGCREAMGGAKLLSLGLVEQLQSSSSTVLLEANSVLVDKCGGPLTIWKVKQHLHVLVSVIFAKFPEQALYIMIKRGITNLGVGRGD